MIKLRNIPKIKGIFQQNAAAVRVLGYCFKRSSPTITF
nr:MAG TPA: hypothetical protein [Caudoviricetes sp.]